MDDQGVSEDLFLYTFFINQFMIIYLSLFIS